MYSTSTFLLGTFTRILSSNNIVRQGRRKRKVKTEPLKNRDRDRQNQRQRQPKTDADKERGRRDFTYISALQICKHFILL